MADTRPPDNDLLSMAALRAANHPHLFASLLGRYADLNNLDDDGLRVEIGCDPDTWNRLKLCLRPDPDIAAFAVDVGRIAESLGLDASILAQIAREVDATDAFTRYGGRVPFSSTPGGMMQAARDHDEAQPGPTREQDAEAEAEGGSGEERA